METAVAARWGLTFPLGGIPLAEQGPACRQLANAGYTDLWTAEAGRPDGLTPLAAAAVWEPTLHLGAGVVSSFTRGPAVLASTAATFADLAPGRFTLGVGSSSDLIVERQNGIAFEQPFSRTRDVVRFLRRALDGERVSGGFDTFDIGGFRLGSVRERPRIVVAALRERMLELAGTEADGAMLNWVSPEDVRAMANIVRAANPDAEIIDRIIVCPSEDREQVERIVRPLAAVYTAVGVYRAFHTWRGRGDALAASWAAYDAGDRAEAAALIPSEVIDAMCVHGSPAACRQRLHEYVDAGVTVPVLAVLPPDGDVLGAALELAPRSADRR